MFTAVDRVSTEHLLLARHVSAFWSINWPLHNWPYDYINCAH